ncbi:MAG: hypothetical protein K2X27_25485 [Candidatus Obscuribacterales bacterium]|nr:hypothetical protein [Candidatus Obscuribacterales bacterium]
MYFGEISSEEQAIIGKQQLLVKMQLAERQSAELAKQQLAVKSGLARAKAASQSNNGA